jgi:hypothetical protein
MALGVDSASSSNEYQNFSGRKAWPAHNAGKLTTTDEPIV